jgi:uncharacterized protein
MDNPFEFGRELDAEELVDRAPELKLVRDTMRSGGKLFLIGPRRFGKTSLLHAAAQQVARTGVVVLRYDAQAFPALEQLTSRLAADAAQRLTTTIDKAARGIREFFASVRPSATFDATNNRWSLSLAGTPGREAGPALLADVLDGVEKAAAASGRKVAVVIDEFQAIVEDGGVDAEEQLRAAMQRHRHVAYLLAGSKTRMLSDMVTVANRPFHRLGTPLFLGPVPRDDFHAFIARGFRLARIPCDDAAIVAMLDAAEDVPYNVQLLAHACWSACRESPRGTAPRRLTIHLVAETNDAEAMRHDPLYTQLWTSLPSTQRRALLAIRREGGSGLTASAVARSYGMAVSTMQRALASLQDKQIVREEQTAGTVRLRLEDPLFAAWLRLVITE